AARANVRAAGSSEKAHRPQRRVPLRNTGTKTKSAAMPPPSRNQLARRIAHRHRHPDRALGRVGARHWIVEEHHDPVARELVQRALELADKRPQSAVIFAQEFENLLRLGGLGAGAVAAQVTENDDSLARMALEDVFGAPRAGQ